MRIEEDPGSFRVDGERSMTKSELIELIAAKQSHLPAKDVELAVKQVLEIMSDALAQGQRIEIRGFGSFSLHFRPPRQGRANHPPSAPRFVCYWPEICSLSRSPRLVPVDESDR